MPVLLTGFSGLGTKISPDNTAPPEVTAAAREPSGPPPGPPPDVKPPMLTRAEAHHEHFAHLRDREPAIVPSTSEETEQTIKDPAVIDAPVEAQGPDGGILSQEGKQEFNMILWGGAAVVALLLLRK